jgi:hypothetical protein|tara:strand:+ start:410 stop:661 length:252 start_codon:yes stop_codon:yes gene_type:complete
MSWFDIIKYDIADNLQDMFPNAKVKLMGTTWKLLYNNRKDWGRDIGFFRTRKEDTDKDFGSYEDKINNFYVISFENDTLKEMA